MRFKDFIQFSEEGQSTDNGMMGFPVASSVRKPSDGQPFKNNGPVAGQTPRGSTGGAGAAQSMFMKKMKKR